MFRAMRRGKQQLPEEEILQILRDGSHAVLALYGDDEYPYAVPVSYAYDNGKLYFHSAVAGHKVDAIARHDRVSACVVRQDDVVSAEVTTYFQSVIAFGRARRLTDDAEIRHAAVLLGEKYCRADREKYRASIERELHAMACFEIVIDHMTGKEAVELTRKRT